MGSLGGGSGGCRCGGGVEDGGNESIGEEHFVEELIGADIVGDELRFFVNRERDGEEPSAVEMKIAEFGDARIAGHVAIEDHNVGVNLIGERNGFGEIGGLRSYDDAGLTFQ